jgi:hypothetical protein
MTPRKDYWYKKLMKDFEMVTPADNLQLLAVIADNTQRIVELLEPKNKGLQKA